MSHDLSAPPPARSAIKVAIIEDEREIRECLTLLVNGTEGYSCTVRSGCQSSAQSAGLESLFDCSIRNALKSQEETMSSPARISVPAAAMLAVLFTSRTLAQTVPPVACASLADRRLPNTTITAAQAVTSGSFTPPGSTNAITNLPPFCRVAGVIEPTSDSHILFEVWLPLQNWNGRFAGVGNGGWAGSISFGALAEQVRRDYP